MGTKNKPEIPLPKGWRRHVRSAVLHVISLAQYATAYTRSWAVDSLNGRVRLKAENDRLLQEVALEQEASRIKDARMARFPAIRRPHYLPTERMADRLRRPAAWLSSPMRCHWPMSISAQSPTEVTWCSSSLRHSRSISEWPTGSGIRMFFDFVGAHLHLAQRLSMRDYHLAWELRESGLDWRRWLLARWGLTGARLLLASLKADDSFCTQEERARAFVERGGGYRATYFNHARKLRASSRPPEILLGGVPPGRAKPNTNLLELLGRRFGNLNSD